MANSTDVSVFVGPVGYVILGLVVGLSNLVIGLSVAKYSAMRQSNQFFFLMALAFGDATNMLGFLTAGLYRLWVLSSPIRLGSALTPIECLWKPHCFLWLFAYPFSSMMLVILSSDRLFLVLCPSTYLLSLPSPRYAQITVLIGFSFTCLMGLLGIVGVYLSPRLPSESPICFTPVARDSPVLVNKVYVYYFEHTSFLALVSVLVFAAVPLVHKLKQNSQQANDNSQKRMTHTIALSCLCTLLLYCLPDRLGYVLFYSGHSTLGMLMFHLSMTNGLANVVIYQLRHREMRQSLVGLLSGKQMPINLTLWPKPNQQPVFVRSMKRAQRAQDQVLELKEL